MRTEYLPNVPGPLKNCLDQAIMVRDSRGHDIEVSFSRYVSPLDEINALMRSISPPPLAEEILSEYAREHHHDGAEPTPAPGVGVAASPRS